MITIRRPAEPPPIQMTLARTGENKRCIVCFSFRMAMYSPPHAKILREGAVTVSLGLHPGGLAPPLELTPRPPGGYDRPPLPPFLHRRVVHYRFVLPRLHLRRERPALCLPSSRP